ncbi:hypothetical protein EV122DRAFT_256649 [Schizophyllum commune]
MASNMPLPRHVYVELVEKAPIPELLLDSLIPDHGTPTQNIGAILVPPHGKEPVLLGRVSYSLEPPQPMSDPSMIMFMQGLPMPQPQNVNALAESIVAQSGAESLIYPVQLAPSPTIQPPRLPLWTVTYWVEAYQLIFARTGWSNARKFVEQAKIGTDIIDNLPWRIGLPHNLGEVSLLQSFCGQDWLWTMHLDIMLTTLRLELNDPAIVVCPTELVSKLGAIYRGNRETYPALKDQQYVARLWQDDDDEPIRKLLMVVPVMLSESGARLTGPNGVDGNHYASLVVDVSTRTVRYFDPMYVEPPADLRDIVSWWLAAHGMHDFTEVLASRGCTRQADWYSCGLLSMNALEHDVAPETYPLIEAAQCDRGRLVMLQRVLRVMNTFDSRFPVPLPARVPRPAKKMSKIMVKGTGSAVTRKWETMDRDSLTALEAPDIPPEPQQAVASIAAELLEHAEDYADEHDSDVDEAEPDTVPHFTRKQLVDVPPPKRDKSKGGRKRNVLLDKLTKKCYYIDNKGERKDVHRCVGDPARNKWCGAVYTTRTLSRWLGHAANCTKIPAALQDEVRDELVKTAPSVQAAALADAQLAKLGDAPPTKAQKTSAASTPGSQKQTVHQIALGQGRKVRHAMLDAAVVVFWCIAGLAPYLVKLPQWKRLWEISDPTYTPATRDRLDAQIMSEAAAVRVKVMEILQEREYLTISYDGGTANNSSRQAFWTFHVSTERGEVFMVEVKEATDVRHTAAWIKGHVLEIMTRIGVSRFIGACCDSTGNTYGSRGLIEGDVKTVLALADAGHHLGNTSKDLVKLPCFKREFEDFFMSDSSWDAACFHKELDDLVALTISIAKAIACLEAVETSPADVYIFWHAVMRNTTEAVTDKSRALSADVQKQVLQVLDRRYNQLFKAGGRLYSPIYVSAAYLSPDYLRNGLFCKESTNGQASIAAFAGIQYPALFQQVVAFLVDVAKNEIMHGDRPQFTRWKGRAKDMKTTLIAEMKAYSRNQYPYNTRFLRDDSSARAWWQALAGQPEATLLPFIAIKIHSIRVNSMPDEHTVSTFTWLTPAVRNRVKIEKLAAITVGPSGPAKSVNHLENRAARPGR